ncbi:MAG: SMP-30/gluconolactonase/LRE family protein [Calditrichia bacterium]
MKKLTRSLLLLSFVIVAWLCFWPVPAEPVSWNAPEAPGYVGPHAVNQKLNDLNIIPLDGGEGPEHVVLGPDSLLYMAVASGNILRMKPDGSELEVFVNTEGRVLGFDFDAAGYLIAADAVKGLLSISPGGFIEVLVHAINGKPVCYANSVVVASDSMIYFSEASTRFAPRLWGGTFEASVLDIIEQSASGRILRYNPQTKSIRIVASGFSFANGVALSDDEKTLFVNETGRYRVWKVAVSAENVDVNTDSNLASILLDNLPGYPDNLLRGTDGKIWLGFAKPRSPIVDMLADKPFLRKVILRLPRALWPVPKAYGHVIAFTEDGIIVSDLQDPTGQYPETTAVTETEDRLYIQSLHAKGLGWLPREKKEKKEKVEKMSANQEVVKKREEAAQP